MDGEKIAWVGPSAELPPLPPDAQRIDATGKTVVPGFIDSHTHLLFAGSRKDESEQRLQGRSYQEISAAAAASMPPSGTSAARTKKEPKELARQRLQRFLHSALPPSRSRAATA